MSNAPRTMVVALKSALDALVAEQTVVEASVGLTSSGGYQPDVSAHYISSVSTVRDAVKTLDTRLFSVATTYAPLTYVQEQISTTLSAAPTTLDTLHEIATALGNDTNLYETLRQQRITEETTARANESTIQGNLNTQSASAIAAEQTLSTTLVNQILHATSAESTLTANLENEITRATGSISTLSSLRFQENANRSTIGFITTSTLQYNISTDLSGGLHNAIEAEMIRAQNADSVISTALYNEVNRSIAAQATLTSTITAEQLRAMTIEQSISTSLASEITRATQEQSTISGRISSIETTYVQKDGSVAFTGTLNLDSNRIVNLSTGTAATTAATKGYVDQRISSLGYVFEYVGTLDAGVITNLDTELPKTAEVGDSYKITGAGTLSFNSGTSTLSVSTRDLIVKNGQGGWDKFADKEMTLEAGSSGSNITVTGSTNAGYSIDIASGYVGQSSITTLGTVTTGVWNASTLATTKGGSGQTSYTLGDLLVGTNTQSTLQKLAIGASNTIVSAYGNQVTYRSAESANIAIATATNFTNLSTTQQALEKLYDETQKRSFAQFYEGYTGDYADADTTNVNWLTGKVNFIQPTTVAEARFEGSAFSASSTSSINYAHHAFDMISSTTWQASQVASNSYIGATGVYQGSISTISLPTLAFTTQQPTFNTTSTDTSGRRNVATDIDGNIYVTYSTVGNLDGKTRTGTTDVVVFKLNAVGTLQWAKQESTFNTTGANTNPQIVCDSTGVVVVYETTGTLPGKTKTSSAGNKDIVLFKLNFSGDLIWTTQSNEYNCTTQNQTVVIDQDRNNNIYIAWGVSSAVPGGTHRAGRDVAVAKFNSSGSLVWVKQQIDWNTTVNDANSLNMNVDPSGNVYVAYYMENGSIPVGAQPWLGRYDGVWFKLNTDGVYQWARQQYNTSDYDVPTILAPTVDDIFLLMGPWRKLDPATGLSINDSFGVIGTFPRNSADGGGWFRDNSGNLYLSFHSQGGIGGGYSIGGWDVAVYKYSVSTGRRIWESFGGTAYATTANDITTSTAIDSNGNVILTYMTQGTVPGGTSKGDYDIVVTKLSQGGSMAAAGTNVRGEWIQMSNATAYGLSKYTMRGLTGRETTFTPTSFTVYGSINNSNWTPLDTQSNLVFSSNEQKTFTLSTITDAYNIYRIVVTGVGSSAGNGSRTCAQIADVNMYTQIGAGGATLYRRLGPANYTTALSAVPGSGGPSGAFDLQPNTFWQGTGWFNSSTGVYGGDKFTTSGGINYPGEWVQIQIPEANSIKQYTLLGRSGQEASTAPNSWRVFGSTDGTTWTLLDTQTNQSFALNETKTYTLAANTLPYTYYRINVHVNGVSGTRNVLAIADWSLYATVPVQGISSGDGSPYTIYLPPTNAGLPNGTILRIVHYGSVNDGNYIIKYKNTTLNSEIQVSEILAGQTMSFIWHGASSTYLNAIGI